MNQEAADDEDQQPSISNGGSDVVTATVEANGVDADADVKMPAGEVDGKNNDDASFQTATSLEVPTTTDSIPDVSTKTDVVPTAVDLEELEKATQKTETATEESVSKKADDEDDNGSVHTEESDDEESSESSSDSDSSDSDDDDDSNSNDSSSSSSSSGDTDDNEDDEEQAILRKEQIYPQSTLMYGDDDEPIFSPEDELRHAFEFRFGDRATVRKMIAQRIKGKHRHKMMGRDGRIMRNHGGSLGPSGRKARRRRVNDRKKKVIYAIIASTVLTIGITSIIFAVTKEREYNRSEAYYGKEEEDQEFPPEKWSPTTNMNGSPTPAQTPITAVKPGPQPQSQPSPAAIPPTPLKPPPSPVADIALLSLIKLQYVESFQSIPGTSGTNQEYAKFVDEVNANYLNPSANTDPMTQSYQWQAYLYLYNSRSDIFNKQTNKIEMSPERIMQIYGLYCFYLQVQWPQEGTKECEWSGVTCQDTNDQPNSMVNLKDNIVISLELPKWQLKGTLPPELAFLPYIEKIDLSNNQLYGPLPTLAMFKWNRLKVLSLHDNQFDSGLSSELGYLTNLQKFTIYHNKFQEATIPKELCHLRDGQLHFLWVDCAVSSYSSYTVSCPEDCCTICFEPVGYGHDSQASTEEITDQLTHETHGVDPNGDMLNKLKAHIGNGSALDDMDSPQYKSYVWLVTHTSYEGVPDLIVYQKYALGTLYFAFGGSGWYENTGWLTDDDVCNWYGVNDCHGGISSALDLSSNNLVGMIPLELMSLRTLIEINFADNAIYGEIPPEIGTFDFLEILLLDKNVLDGGFPSELGNIPTLKQLTLNSNELKGGVPVSICSLMDSGLMELWTDCWGPEVTCDCCTKCFKFGEVHPVNENAPPADTNNEQPAHSSPPADTTDTIVQTNGENAELKSMLIKHMSGLETNPLSDKESPPYKAYLWLANSSNLNELDVFRKLRRFGLMSFYLATSPNFSWKVDSGWKTTDHECTWYGISCEDNEVIEISLASNRLSGSIPPEFALGGLGGKVSSIDLSQNSIGGSLPSELGDFHNLQVLDLKFNSFEGAIPIELKQLTKLTTLRLHSNKFDGAMPEEICSLRFDRNGDLAELTADCDPVDPFDHVICDDETCCTFCY